MSLYIDAAAALAHPDGFGGSMKSRIYSSNESKKRAAQIYALIMQTTKWSKLLKEVVENSEILQKEKKLDAVLVMFLVHDLLLSEKGIVSPQNHPLRAAVTRHKSRLNAELTRLRIQKGFESLEALRQHVDQGEIEEPGEMNVGHYQRPRWVRINVLKTSLNEQLKSTFAGYREVHDMEAILTAPSDKRVLLRDAEIPDLVAIPSGQDLTKSEAYKHGQIILQDKAACFPAFLLDVSSIRGDIIDACAAPGNKTTQLAALSKSCRDKSPLRKILAFEKDAGRSHTLRKMVSQAGADEVVTIFGKTDFLGVRPSDSQFREVEAILLDPSCSGNGIVGRDDRVQLHLPRGKVVQTATPSIPRKRRRKAAVEEPASEIDNVEAEGGVVDPQVRLRRLSAFQLRILCHAMSFPAALRIVYSTCSTHNEENERVVTRALCSSAARGRGWKFVPRKEQVARLQSWEIRGDEAACAKELAELSDIKGLPDAHQLAQACIRCKKGTLDGTMGFFAVALARDRCDNVEDMNEISHGENVEETEEDEAEEWNGFSDSD